MQSLLAAYLINSFVVRAGAVSDDAIPAAPTGCASKPAAATMVAVITAIAHRRSLARLRLVRCILASPSRVVALTTVATLNREERTEQRKYSRSNHSRTPDVLSNSQRSSTERGQRTVPRTTTSARDPRIAAFADELRKLHLQAGKPGFREMQKATNFGRTALSQALNGAVLPTWQLTDSLVKALGGDREEWRQRWAAAAQKVDRDQEDPPADIAQAPRSPAPRSRSWVIGGVVVALAVAVAAIVYLSTGSDHENASALPTDPAAGVIGGTCMKVTAKDVRVFVGARSDDTWTTWPDNTRFWIDPNASSPSRYRTTLRNGQHAWVTSNGKHVTASDDCP